MEKVEYEVVQQSNLTELKMQVEHLINFGFIPLGGVSVYFDRTFGKEFFIQAMLKDN